MVVGAVRANAVFRSCQFFLDSENKTEKFHFFHQIKINMTGLMKGFLKWILSTLYRSGGGNGHFCQTRRRSAKLVFAIE